MYLSLLQIKNFRCFDGNEYTMDSVYKLPDTWTPTFDLSNHEKVSARNDYAGKPLKKVVEEIVERKNGDRMQRICRILSGLSLIISMTV